MFQSYLCMQRHALLFLCLFTGFGLLAQAPQAFKFQAVARDADNMAYDNRNIGVRVSVLKGGAAGTVAYRERHAVMTSDLGVFDLSVGEGTVLSGDLTSVDWGADDYYLQIDLDPAGGTNYTNLGATQLLSVPYALHAASVDLNAIDIEDADADPNNEIQQLSLRGSNLILSGGGGSVDLPAAAASPWEEIRGGITYTGNFLSTSAPSTISFNSIISNPQLTLREVGNDFARLEFRNDQGDNYWHVAGLAGDAADSRLNFYFNNGTGRNRMSVTGDGKVGINAGNPTARLFISQGGQDVGLGLRFKDGTANQDWDITHGFGLRFHYGGALRGFINATTGAYTQSSDLRLKKNIQSLSEVLPRVAALRAMTYQYKDATVEQPTIGLIAQDTRKLFPELVSYSAADDIYGIDYAGFSVVALKAIQEQQTTIETQAARMANLEARLERLEAAIGKDE